MTDLIPIDHLSFPDQRITAWSANSNIVRIRLSGAFLLTVIDVPVELTIAEWSSFQSRSFHDGHWSYSKNFEPLKDICECSLSSDPVILRGFGAQSGKWLEHCFHQGRVRAFTAQP